MFNYVKWYIYCNLFIPLWNIKQKVRTMKKTVSLNIKLAASLARSFGIQQLPGSIDQLISNLKVSDIPPIVYLKAKTCTGCSVSLVNLTQQEPSKLIVDQESLFTKKGHMSPHNIAVDLIKRYLNGNMGDYFFAVEGAIPKDPAQCYMANHPISEWIKKGGQTSLMGLAFGNCAMVGASNARSLSPDYFGLKEYFRYINISKNVISIPGCPIEPENIWHAILHLFKMDYPKVKLSKNIAFTPGKRT